LGDGLFETMRAREGHLPWGGAAVIGLSAIPDDAVLAGAITRSRKPTNYPRPWSGLRSAGACRPSAVFYRSRNQRLP
jgi:hypothetical protein